VEVRIKVEKSMEKGVGHSVKLPQETLHLKILRIRGPSPLSLWRTWTLSFKGSGENQLLASELPCHCGEIAVLNKRSQTTDGYTFRCKGVHEMGMRKFSFFQGSFYDIMDLILLKKMLSWRTVFINQPHVLTCSFICEVSKSN
jgi:hypothetical protein